MTTLGTALTPNAIKVMMLGSGELGKEVVIELQRLGVEVIAVDRYENAPAQQVAHRAYTISMLDGAALKAFVDNFADFQSAVEKIGIPCVVKPIMSSSGHGQSILKSKDDLQKAWDYAQQGGRTGAGRVIVEGFVKFDYEITLLTVRHINGTSYLAPIGHRQEDGDYRESWQPQAMSDVALKKAQDIAEKITTALGGRGIFGVEMFVCGDEVIFNEVSPRPHDTGMVTLISQELSEFALHARAILGLPIPEITLISPSASKAIVVEGQSKNVQFGNIAEVLAEPHTNIRIFGKGEVNGHRRLGVLLARDISVEKALEKVERAYAKLNVKL